MPATLSSYAEQTHIQLAALGKQISLRRKALNLSAVVTAQAAGLSRVTLHRIEKGEPSVTIGSWANVWASLGMNITAQAVDATPVDAAPDTRHRIPVRIRLADYPQLKALAWQLHGIEALQPAQAQSIYERNAQHLDTAALTDKERALMQALTEAFGDTTATPRV